MITACVISEDIHELFVSKGFSGRGIAVVIIDNHMRFIGLGSVEEPEVRTSYTIVIPCAHNEAYIGRGIHLMELKEMRPTRKESWKA